MAMPLIFIRIGNAVGKPFGLNPFPRAFANAGSQMGRQAAFDAIYQHNGWNSTESPSGPGSEVNRAKAYRLQLDQCLDRLGCNTMFDAPCGDLNWILPVLRDRKYVGGDIARSLVADLRISHPGLDLRVFDI